MVDAFLYAHAPVCFGEGNIVFIMQRCCYLLPISGGKKMNGTLSILSKICAIYQLADIFIAHLGAYVAIFIFQHAFQGSRNGLSLYRIQCNRFNSIIIQLLFILPFLACLLNFKPPSASHTRSRLPVFFLSSLPSSCLKVIRQEPPPLFSMSSFHAPQGYLTSSPSISLLS